jgi:hypothetical protein
MTSPEIIQSLNEIFNYVERLMLDPAGAFSGIFGIEVANKVGDPHVLVSIDESKPYEKVRVENHLKNSGKNTYLFYIRFEFSRPRKFVNKIEVVKLS